MRRLEMEAQLNALVTQNGPDNSDVRRDIFDLLDPKQFPEGVRHVNIIVFKEQQPGRAWAGGNHYHNDTEVFRVACGVLKTLILEDVDTGVRVVFKDLGPGTTINIPPRVAHATEPTNGLVLIGALIKGFNANDLNPYPLMDPITCKEI